MLNCKINIPGKGYFYPHELMEQPRPKKPLDQLFYDVALQAKVQSMRQGEPVIFHTSAMSMAEIKEDKHKHLFNK